jgi:hypothetical protein
MTEAGVFRCQQLSTAIPTGGYSKANILINCAAVSARAAWPSTADGLEANVATGAAVGRIGVQVGTDPRSRGLSGQRVFFCGECCITAHVQGWRYQWWVFTRHPAGHCELDSYNISVCKRTLLSILHSESRKITSSGAKIVWFNQTP